MADLNAHGLGMSLPTGWEGRIYRRTDGDGVRAGAAGDAPPSSAAADGALAYPVLHVGNFALPIDIGDFGSGAVEVMESGDVLVVLFEYGPESVGAPLFAATGVPGPLVAGDFSPDVLQRTIRGQAGVQRFFSAAGRAFCLYVVVGSYAERAHTLALVNEAIASIAIALAPAS